VWMLRLAPHRPERRWLCLDLDLAQHGRLRVEEVLDERTWVIRSELRDGQFSRLPGPLIVVDAAKTAYEDCILEVRIPWLAGAETVSTKVPISRS